jgi:hypothetical protein
MWDEFERALAAGLRRGQVLRCRTATVLALDARFPEMGPWVVTAGKNVRVYDSARIAARAWHRLLWCETMGGGQCAT